MKNDFSEPKSDEGLGTNVPVPFSDTAAFVGHTLPDREHKEITTLLNELECVANNCEQLLHDLFVDIEASTSHLIHHSAFVSGVISEDKYFHAKNSATPTRWIWRDGCYRRCASPAPCAHAQAFMHTVKGVPRHGVLIDPGAARGLIGTQTRKEFDEQVLQYTDYTIQYRKSYATLSGIEGQPKPAKDACDIPLGVDGDVIYFPCDSIDGAGSRCPGLLSNQTFIEKKMTLMAGFFKNNDGLLHWEHPLQGGGFKSKYCRVYLTDSGHYLLPIDRFDGWDGKSDFDTFHASTEVSEDGMRTAQRVLHRCYFSCRNREGRR